MEGSGANYNWITIGVMENPENFDLNHLKAKALEFVKRSEYKPTTNMIRVDFRKNGKSYMKTTFLDVWDP